MYTSWWLFKIIFNPCEGAGFPIDSIRSNCEQGVLVPILSWLTVIYNQEGNVSGEDVSHLSVRQTKSFFFFWNYTSKPPFVQSSLALFHINQFNHNMDNLWVQQSPELQRTLLLCPICYLWNGSLSRLLVIESKTVSGLKLAARNNIMFCHVFCFFFLSEWQPWERVYKMCYWTRQKKERSGTCPSWAICSEFAGGNRHQ